MTGFKDPRLDDNEVGALRRHLQAGGFLFINKLLGLQHLPTSTSAGWFQSCLPTRTSRRSPGKTASSNRSTTSRWVKIVSQVSRGPSNSKASRIKKRLVLVYSKKRPWSPI